MGYFYGFRLGDADKFKFGQTAQTPEKRRPTLQTGCPYPLIFFDAIESDDYKALEKYVKDEWGHRRGSEGGTEIYNLTQAEAAQVFQQCRDYLADELPKIRRVRELQDLEPEPTLLPSDDTALRLRQRWIELNAEDTRLAALRAQVQAEKELIEIELKLAIGATSGIDGVATWERTIETRRINPELVKATDQGLFEQCQVPKFDATKLKTLLKTFGKYDYESFQEVRRTRDFKITE
ncbi:GIY-YIG nuclease family protein [Nocardia sp. NPDC004750]